MLEIGHVKMNQHLRYCIVHDFVVDTLSAAVAILPPATQE
jgi:hypothetical protein